MLTEPLADWAVYCVPPADHALYQVCASVLGWDCRRETRLERPALPGIPVDLLASWVGPATYFGPHATVSGWMRVPVRHRDRIVDDVATISRQFAPIELMHGRFPMPDDFWHPSRAPTPILVAVFDEPLGAMRALHAEILVRFNPLASSSTYDDHAELADYTARHRWRIDRYHEARVLEDFEFHLSFATGTPGADAVDRLRRAIVDGTGLFEREADTRWLVDELALFERRPDGYWRLAEIFKLAG